MEHKQRGYTDIAKRFFLEPWEDMKWVFLRSLIFPIISSLISILIVECMKNIVDGVQVGDTSFAAMYLWYFVGIVIIWLVARRLTKNQGHPEIRPTGGRKLSQKYLSKYLMLDNNKIETWGTGRLITIFEKGIWTWTEMLAMVFSDITKLCANMFFLLLYVFTLNLLYGFGFLFLISLVVVGYILTQQKANYFRRVRRDYYIEYMRSFVKIIMSKFEMLQSGSLGKELKTYDEHFPKRYKLNKSIETYRFLSEGFSVLVVDGLRIFAIVSVLRGTALGTITVGEFVALISILVMLDQITWDISRKYIDMTNMYIYVEKLWDLVDTTPQIVGFETGKMFSYTSGTIVFDNISYAYDKEHIFDRFSLTLQGGKKTALVGMSGAGKTTLVKLLAGYLRPSQGSVLVDGQDLREVSLKSYYQHIGYLTQEPMVFDGTVRENLTYGMDTSSLTPEAVAQKVSTALLAAKCEFIYEFPQGVGTEIGERGIRLSGGQRQRLAIAKIFLKNPEIIILDEPTAALDSFSEEAITQAMHNLFVGRTVIIIAHRLQTVKAADDIIVLEDGEVQERGTHDELVLQGGQYAKMLALQSGF